jgi:hypothetical protein
LGASVASAEAAAADVAVGAAAAPNPEAPELVPVEGPYVPSPPQAELAINTSNSSAKLASVMRRRISFSNILSRLGLRDRTQAAIYARENGLVKREMD